MTGASNIGKAGVATIAFRLGQAMDERKVQISYLAQRGMPDAKYIQMIEDKGGKIYFMDKDNRKHKYLRILQTMQWVLSVCRQDTYDAIHINTDTAYLAAVYIFLAKKAGIRKVIVHCHSTMVDENHKILRAIKITAHKLCCRYVQNHSDLKLACSNSAARWLFGKCPVTIIPNGFDVDKFAFDEQKRNEYRKALDIMDKLVICSVARLAYQKNPIFTIDIYREILKKEKNCVLLLIGDGELRNEVEEYLAKNYLNAQQVVLLGNRNDIPELLSASDVFVLPSRFEGLGIVYLEAQASGMPVFASDMVPKEAFATNLIHKIPLSETPKHWAKKIVEHLSDERLDERESIKARNFDITRAAQMLQEKYMELNLKGTD